LGRATGGVGGGGPELRVWPRPLESRNLPPPPPPLQPLLSVPATMRPLRPGAAPRIAR